MQKLSSVYFFLVAVVLVAEMLSAIGSAQDAAGSPVYRKGIRKRKLVSGFKDGALKRRRPTTERASVLLDVPFELEGKSTFLPSPKIWFAAA